MRKTTIRYCIVIGLVIFLSNVHLLIAAPAKPYVWVPDEVEVGDILFMGVEDWLKKTKYLYHTALYIGDNKLIHIIPRDEGLDDIVIWDWNDFYYSEFVTPDSLEFYRVDPASDDQIQNAIDWIYDRRDDNAQFQDWWRGMRKISDPDFNHRTADMFYCSELPWAAYYNQGIDIDFNEWSPCGYENCPGAQVWRFDIIVDSDTSKVWP
jgi:hypothetical protein